MYTLQSKIPVQVFSTFVKNPIRDANISREKKEKEENMYLSLKLILNPRHADLFILHLIFKRTFLK